MDKALNSYELVVIFSASLEDEALDKMQLKYEEYFKNNAIEVFDIEKLGRKRMAYQIKKNRTGYYLIFRFKSNGDFISKLERTLQLDEQLLRHLTVKMEKKDLDYWQLCKTRVVTADTFDVDTIVDTVSEIPEKNVLITS